MNYKENKGMKERYTYKIEFQKEEKKYLVRLYQVKEEWKEGTDVGLGDYKASAILQDETTESIKYFNRYTEALEYMSRHTVQEEMERGDRIGQREMDRMGIKDEEVVIEPVVEGYILSGAGGVVGEIHG